MSIKPYIEKIQSLKDLGVGNGFPSYFDPIDNSIEGDNIFLGYNEVKETQWVVNEEVSIDILEFHLFKILQKWAKQNGFVCFWDEKDTIGIYKGDFWLCRDYLLGAANSVINYLTPINKASI